MDPRNANPFRLDWIKREKRGEYCVPSDSLVPMILKHFGIRADMTMSVKVVERIVRAAFVAFWDVSKFEQHGIKMVGKKIIYGDASIDIVRTRRDTGCIVHEIDGWLSTEGLNSIFIRAAKTSANTYDTNPFLKATGKADILSNYKRNVLTLPDSTILPALYASLGVQNFNELNLSHGELEQLVKLGIGTKYNDIWETTDYDGTIIHALEVADTAPLYMNPTIVFVDTVPLNFRKQLEVILETRKNPQGFIGVKADLFQQITKGEIRGKHLGQLCISNKELLARCTADNYRIFRDALEREFEIKWPKKLGPDGTGLYGYTNPRSLYGQLYTAYVYVYFQDITRGYVISGSKPTEPGFLIVPGPGDPKLERSGGEMAFILNVPRPDQFSFILVVKTGKLIGAKRLLDYLTNVDPKAVNEFIQEVIAWYPIANEHGHYTLDSEVIAKYFPGKRVGRFDKRELRW